MIPKKRQVSVIDTHLLSQNLKRIVFQGKQLLGLTQEDIGKHVKLFFKDDLKQVMRSYTIADFDEQRLTLSIDFVIGRHKGLATDWALKASQGDAITIAGPGPLKLKNFNEASYLLIGDLTSINAVAAYAKRVEAAKTKVIIDTPDSINAAMVKQHWPSHFEVIDSSTGTEALDKALINAVNSLNTKPQVFMGVEASVNKRLLKRLTQELNIPKSNISASPYWKQGVSANQLTLLKKLGAA